MNEHNYLNEMIWVPGRGPDEELLRALAARYAKPREALGEAWFMGKTRYIYDDLNVGGIEAVNNERLDSAFETVLGGLMAFPEMACWSEWYGYLTTRILGSRRHLESDSLIGQMREGVFLLSLFNEGQRAYTDQTQFAALLAGIILEERFWSGQSYTPLWRKKSGGLYKDAYWRETDLSMSFFLAWRYLAPKAIRPWLRSVMAIQDIRWRAYLLVWLVQLRPVFVAGKANIATLMSCHRSWQEFSRLFIPFELGHRRGDLGLVSSANIHVLQSALRAEFTEEIFFGWLEDFYSVQDMGHHMEAWMEQFQQLFLD